MVSVGPPAAAPLCFSPLRRDALWCPFGRKGAVGAKGADPDPYCTERERCKTRRGRIHCNDAVGELKRLSTVGPPNVSNVDPDRTNVLVCLKQLLRLHCMSDTTICWKYDGIPLTENEKTGCWQLWRRVWSVAVSDCQWCNGFCKIQARKNSAFKCAHSWYLSTSYLGLLFFVTCPESKRV